MMHGENRTITWKLRVETSH